MKAAIVTQSGRTPVYGDFKEPPPTASGESRIAVTAAALSPVVKSRASGAHYSATGGFPFVVGIDGVGRLDDGRRVYFILPSPPYGSMAQQVVVPSWHCAVLPDGLDDVKAAALANPGLSSWAALTERARFKAGETVLINGATGTSGRLAVQIARHLGAGRIIATARNEQALKAVGADATVVLGEDADALDARLKEHFAAGVDVVLDYLWGRSAERLLAVYTKTVEEGVPLRYIQIGNAGGASIPLPASILRSAAIALMGSGLGSVPLRRIVGVIEAMLHAAVKSGFKVETKTAPLRDVEQTWTSDRGVPRIVFTLANR
jgi:NADPH:quinone reductase-like Zn-dependent oxidoreductase